MPIVLAERAPARRRERGRDRRSDADAARRLHELRNAINTASVASMLLRRSLQTGSIEGALELVAELESVCVNCNALLREDGLRLH